jgi:hypothetical protein
MSTAVVENKTAEKYNIMTILLYYTNKCAHLKCQPKPAQASPSQPKPAQASPSQPKPAQAGHERHE